ncbi:MAG: tetratricopeptide repeat protein [Kiritimatiellaeota bacterium]|nr:tetratricopeptide repeat protein [Kiritimatiellota bacterium]
MPLQPTVSAAVLFACVSLWPMAWGFAHAQVGSVIENIEMPTLDGGKHHLLTDADVNVFVFFRPGQEHSRDALKQLAAIEKETAGKSVHWAAIVSDRVPKADAEAAVKESGIAMPVLIDVGDALNSKLGVVLLPVVGITGKNHKLVAYQFYTKLNYSEVVRARIRHLLKEIDDAELAKALNPPAAVPQGDSAAAARPRFMLAKRYYKAGKYSAALKSVKKSIKKDSTRAAAYVLLGQILAAQGNNSDAIKAFDQALALDPTNVAALEGKKACEGKAAAAPAAK